jgi:hypothetical protein
LRPANILGGDAVASRRVPPRRHTPVSSGDIGRLALPPANMPEADRWKHGRSAADFQRRQH